MKEQSHKDEMSKALRGDFERLRGRGVATTLAPRDESDSTVVPEPVEHVELSEEPDPEASVTEHEAVSDPPPEDPPTADDEPSTGWLDRLLGR